MRESTELRATRMGCAASFLISTALGAVIADIEARYIPCHFLAHHET